MLWRPKERLSERRGSNDLANWVLKVTMVTKSNARVRNTQTFAKARRRALARLAKGIDLRWRSPSSRDELHERVSTQGNENDGPSSCDR